MPQDTERTYFDPLNVRFIVECMTGIKPLRVVSERKKVTHREQKSSAGLIDPSTLQLILGVTFHLLLLAGTVWLGYWSLAAAWIVGMAVFFPVFYAVRQVLEHRDERAESRIDYRIIPHGAVNRLFGDGPLASTFGGAGFNRHLLHHWEPQLSYTSLKDLEVYLMETDAAAILTQHRTSYLKIFTRLFSN